MGAAHSISDKEKGISPLTRRVPWIFPIYLLSQKESVSAPFRLSWFSGFVPNRRRFALSSLDSSPISRLSIPHQTWSLPLVSFGFGSLVVRLNGRGVLVGVALGPFASRIERRHHRQRRVPWVFVHGERRERKRVWRGINEKKKRVKNRKEKEKNKLQQFT